MSDYSIRIQKIEKSFKLKKLIVSNSKIKTVTIPVLNAISLDIKPGEMIGVIGKNGSGKSTLLRLIAGIYQPNKGNITINGSIGPLLKIGLGANEEYSVEESITLYGMLIGISKEKIVSKIEEILKFAEIEEYRFSKMKHLSTGMRARVMFSTSLQIDPDILLIDEVMSVGDISFRQKSFKAFLKFKENKKTIILVTHNMEQAQKLCDKVLVLDRGNTIFYGEPKKAVEEYKKIIQIKK